MSPITGQQRRPDFVHFPFGIVVRLAQDAGEQGKTVGFYGLQEDGFGELADCFETAVARPGSYGALDETTKSELDIEG